MKESQATAVLGVLSAAYKGAEIPDETKALWRGELLRFEFQDAIEAVTDLARLTPFMPALSEILDACIETRNDRILRERALEHRQALPAETSGSFMSFSEWLATQDEEMVARAMRVIPTATRNALDRAEKTTRQQPLPS